MGMGPGAGWRRGSDRGGMVSPQALARERDGAGGVMERLCRVVIRGFCWVWVLAVSATIAGTLAADLEAGRFTPRAEKLVTYGLIFMLPAVGALWATAKHQENPPSRR